jgi:hypothetical protein
VSEGGEIEGEGVVEGRVEGARRVTILRTVYCLGREEVGGRLRRAVIVTAPKASGR